MLEQYFARGSVQAERGQSHFQPLFFDSGAVLSQDLLVQRVFCSANFGPADDVPNGRQLQEALLGRRTEVVRKAVAREAVREIAVEFHSRRRKECPNELEQAVVVDAVHISDIVQTEGGGPVGVEEALASEDTRLVGFGALFENVDEGRAAIGIVCLRRQRTEAVVNGIDVIDAEFDRKNADQAGRARLPHCGC
jgi:hypothetical protein